MRTYQFSDYKITLDKEGARAFSKVSFPLKYGLYSEIETRDHVYQFDLNGEIKWAQGRNSNWPDQLEWLKRTMANDWVYYRAGNYSGVFDFMGEYYLPAFSYPSNFTNGRNPFEETAVRQAISGWEQLSNHLRATDIKSAPTELKPFLTKVISNDKASATRRSTEFHRITSGQISVLPPDARHVDYEVIPVLVAEGCMYHCGFCNVKSRKRFSPQSKTAVIQQIGRLKAFYGENIRNYNAIFLGQHDALGVGRELLEFAAESAYSRFEFDKSYINGKRLFMFGCADSLLNSEEAVFETLNNLPYYTYINVGLESADAASLKALKKPITPDKVNRAFERALAVNRQYQNLEVTVNLVWGDQFLPDTHIPACMDLLGNHQAECAGKGVVYISPLMGQEGIMKGILKERAFHSIKNKSRLPVYLYMIQRL